MCDTPTMPPMRILLLTDFPPEQEFAPVSRLFHLAELLREQGHAVSLFGSYSGHPHEVNGVSVTALPYCGRGKQQSIFPFRPGVRAAIRESDAVIVRGYWLAFFVLLYAWLLRKPRRLFDFHGSTWREVRDQPVYRVLSRCMEAISFRTATDILAVSEGIAGELPQRLQKKITVLENGVDAAGLLKEGDEDELGFQLTLDPEHLCIGVVARFGHTLELETLKASLAHVTAPVEVVILGDGPRLDAVDFEGMPNVHLVGRRSHREVCQFLDREVDVALVPYDGSCEQAKVPGFFSSRKLKEYLALGVPVVAPDIPGLEPWLRDAQAARLYEAGNGQSLAAVWDALATDFEALQFMGETSRALSVDYTWNAVAERSGFLQLFGGGGRS